MEDREEKDWGLGPALWSSGGSLCQALEDEEVGGLGIERRVFEHLAELVDDEEDSAASAFAEGPRRSRYEIEDTVLRRVRRASLRGDRLQVRPKLLELE